jgi:hypothetical protein
MDPLTPCIGDWDAGSVPRVPGRSSTAETGKSRARDSNEQPSAKHGFWFVMLFALHQGYALSMLLATVLNKFPPFSAFLTERSPHDFLIRTVHYSGKPSEL